MLPPAWSQRSYPGSASSAMDLAVKRWSDPRSSAPTRSSPVSPTSIPNVSRRAPQAKTYLDYRRLLEDPSIDAVLIATPQHLHREHFVAAIEASKHVYQEKTLAFTVEDAKRMREAYRRSPKLVVQVGHQSCSSADMVNSLELLKNQRMGKITEIVMHQFRNTPHGQPQWSRPVTADMTPEHIIWNSFLGDAPSAPSTRIVTRIGA